MPLAQSEYVKALLTIYASEREDLELYAGDGYPIPNPVLQLSGKCILMRIADPTEFDIEACVVEAEVVQQKLFGNPLEHMMDDYRERVNRIVTKGLMKL